MFLLFKRIFSILSLILFVTVSPKAQSNTQAVSKQFVAQESHMPLQRSDVVGIRSDSTPASVTDPDGHFRTGNLSRAGMDFGYASDEIIPSSGRNKNTLKVTGTLNHKLNAQPTFRTDYSGVDRFAFQKNLYVDRISLKSAAFRRAVIAPALFVAAGLSTLDADNDDNYEIQEERNRHLPSFRHRVDDYLQHSPIVIVYGLNWLGVKGKNDFANRTAILIKSEAIVGILTFSLKRITAVPRPDTKELTSFPSGHTAQAFAAATFMAKEYGHKNIWYSIGAYTVATAVGTLRVMNNRHWMSDVLVGAGIGILSTNLVYLTHQYRWGKRSKAGRTSVIPSYDGQTGMVSIIHQIK